MNISKLDEILKKKYKTTIPDVKVGSTVKIVIKLKEKTKDKDKNKTQTIQGLVISKKHGGELGGHFVVRRILDGIGTE
jgi:large subunit ribosomal protein L19